MSIPDDDMSCEDEDNCYPVDADVLDGFSQMIRLIKENLSDLDPHHLRAAAVTLLALERLPRTTPGVNVVFGFRTPMERGSWAWADISIGNDCISLGNGEHFDSGDSESRTKFQIYSGGYEGSVRDWVELASMIFPDGIPSIEDYSDHDNIDWTI